MSRRLACTLFLWLVCRPGAFAQEVPRYFQLLLPDFFATPFDGATSVIDLPDRPIRRLSIVVLQATERNISSSSVRVWVNGKGMGNVLEARGVEAGLLFNMDPATLNKRPDELFDPVENAIEVVATDRRGRRYYQSWILRSGAGQNSYFAYSGAVNPDDPQGAPPELMMEEPLIPPVLRKGQDSVEITLRGICASSNPATAIKLNGYPLFNVQDPKGPFSQKVQVTRATRELVLEAVDARNNKRTVVIPVLMQQNEGPPAHFAGQKYALVIGVSRYGPFKDAPPELRFAAADAGEMARQLQQVAGFRPENIRLLLDDQATRAQVRTAFSDFAAKAQANDMLVVYVAAHGLHDPRPGKSDKLYLAPFGTQLSQIDSTALSFEDLEMLLSKSAHSNQTFLIFDVGHKVEGDWKFPGRNLVNNHLLNLFSEQEGRAVLVSGSADEDSQVQAQGGLFARSFVRALSGEADLNMDRVVTADELFRYVAGRVHEDSQGAQNPRYRIPSRNLGVPLGELAGQ